jgi:hypothetical protein
LGDGVPKLALGGPPGGVPGADPSSGPETCCHHHKQGPGGAPRGAIFGGSGLAGGKSKLSPVSQWSIGGGPGGPPKSALGALPAGGPKKGARVGLCGGVFTVIVAR